MMAAKIRHPTATPYFLFKYLLKYGLEHILQRISFVYGLLIAPHLPHFSQCGMSGVSVITGLIFFGRAITF